MPRLMSTAMATAICAPVLRPAILCSLQFADNTLYMWSGLGPITWNGMTFIGVGTLGSISAISEDSTVEAKGVVFSLSGIPSTIIAEVLWETRLLYTAKVWFALFDANGVLIPSPICSYVGKMDQPSLEDNADTCTIAIATENVLIDLNRPCFRRYTADDQQQDLASTLARLGLPSTTVDTFGRFVPGVQELQVFWGRLPKSSNG